MILFEEAKNLIEKNSFILGVEKIKIENSSGFILAENIFANESHPLFSNSAVDGFAVNYNDVKNASLENKIKLKTTDTCKAGDTKKILIKNSCAVKIMTGAKIPDNCTAIVMIEDCEISNGFVEIRKAPSKNENIRFFGEDIKRGEKIIEKGKEITPAVIALLASLGIKKINVFKKPKISLLTTGNELVGVGEKIKSGKIRNSNKYFLASSLNDLGFKIVFQSHNIKDEEEKILKNVKKAISKSDIVLITGGVSVGEFDFVKTVFKKLKVKEIFWQVKVKPGKPTFFGKLKNKFIVGLPGNPVAVGVIFYTLVLPLLNKLSNKNSSLIKKIGVLNKSITKKGNRLEFLRGKIEHNNGKIFVTPIQKQQSHMISGLAMADCLINFSSEKKIINKGEKATIDILPWKKI